MSYDTHRIHAHTRPTYNLKLTTAEPRIAWDSRKYEPEMWTNTRARRIQAGKSCKIQLWNYMLEHYVCSVWWMWLYERYECSNIRIRTHTRRQGEWVNGIRRSGGKFEQDVRLKWNFLRSQSWNERNSQVSLSLFTSTFPPFRSSRQTQRNKI